MKRSKKNFIALMALFLSLTLHAGIFTGLGYLTGMNLKNTNKFKAKHNKKEIFSIEAIEAKDLPDINKIGEKSNINKKQGEKNLQKSKIDLGLEQKNPKIFSKSDNGEESLNFEDIIKLNIQKARNYPEKARQERIEGDVWLSFEVLKSGELGNAFLIKSSGYEILDNEAINTLKRAAPFPEIPEYYDMQKINLQVKIIYKLN